MTKPRDNVTLELHRTQMLARIPPGIRAAIEDAAREFDARVQRDREQRGRKGGRPRKPPQESASHE